MIKVTFEYNAVDEPHATMTEGSIALYGTLSRSEIVAAAVTVVATHHIEDDDIAKIINDRYKGELEEVITTIVERDIHQRNHDEPDKSSKDSFSKFCK